MNRIWRLTLLLMIALVVTAVLSPRVLAQTSDRDRILETVKNAETATVRGGVHPLARPEFDIGKLDDSFQLQRVMLLFKLSASQQAELDVLVRQQSDPSSPNYHKWLTPEQFADRFGISTNDLATVTKWLSSQGMTVVDVARSRTWVAFSGSTRQISAALHTEMHRYSINGVEHHANANDPSLPRAFSEVVLGVTSLDDFKPVPRASARTVSPNFTSSISGNHFLSPDDFATIYNVKGLYNSGIDGTGQKIAVVGQTDIVQSDIDAFRTASGLPPTHLQVLQVTGAPDPGIVTRDLTEADLDIEWAGAVARNASIIYVNSGNGAFDSLSFAIANNVAPVISISYGNCEQGLSATSSAALAALGQQANAQGQTIVAAAGDSGAADCDFGTPTAPITSATHGLAVDIPAALPSVTGVGGGQFNEGTGTFWSTTNTSSGGSALSYIPESAWNNTVAGGPLSSGGGGKSLRFSKPVWQVGVGVPNDNARDVPDVSFSASASVDGYLVCSQGRCVNGFRAADSTLDVVGGTSAGAPVFAGVIALLNQKVSASQGNINAALYSIAGSTPTAFHDITTGDNKVPCTVGTPDCPTGTTTIGFSAGPGYDMATGLGSVDAAALAAAWINPNAGFQLTFASSSLSLTRGVTVTDPGNLVAVGGFTGAITTTCSVSSALVGVTCSVSPNPANPGDQLTLSVTVPQTAALHGGPGMQFFGWPESGLLASGIVLAGRRRKRSMTRNRRKLATALTLAAFAFVVILSACGGSATRTVTPPVTPPPTTGIVTVQATSGALTHSVQLSATLR